MKRIVIACHERYGFRHRWREVPGIHSTPDHPYTERRCVHCGMYEGDVR